MTTFIDPRANDLVTAGPPATTTGPGGDPAADDPEPPGDVDLPAFAPAAPAEDGDPAAAPRVPEPGDRW
jgi:hypothetical protein